MDRRAAGTFAGVPFGALMAAVFGFVVLAAVACGNGRAVGPPSVTPGSPLTSHSASPATIDGQMVIRNMGNNGVGGPPGFVACMARHGVTEQNLVGQGEHSPTYAEVVSALNACSTAIATPGAEEQIAAFG